MVWYYIVLFDRIIVASFRIRPLVLVRCMHVGLDWTGLIVLSGLYVLYCTVWYSVLTVTLY